MSEDIPYIHFTMKDKNGNIQHYHMDYRKFNEYLEQQRVQMYYGYGQPCIDTIQLIEHKEIEDLYNTHFVKINHRDITRLNIESIIEEIKKCFYTLPEERKILLFQEEDQVIAKSFGDYVRYKWADEKEARYWKESYRRHTYKYTGKE